MAGKTKQAAYRPSGGGVADNLHQYLQDFDYHVGNFLEIRTIAQQALALATNQRTTPTTPVAPTPPSPVAGLAGVVLIAAAGATWNGVQTISASSGVLQARLAFLNTTALIKGDGAGGLLAGVPGTDYVTPSRSIATNNGLVGGGNLSADRTLGLSNYSGATTGYVPSKDGSGGLTWISPSGTGTVTSVDASGGSTGLTFSGGPITTSGTLMLAGTLSIANGGTGQTTANAALNALLPSQGGNNGKVLGTNGTNTSWVSSGGGGYPSGGPFYTAGFDGSGNPVAYSNILIDVNRIKIVLGSEARFAGDATYLNDWWFTRIGRKLLLSDNGADAVEFQETAGSFSGIKVHADIQATGNFVAASGNPGFSGTVPLAKITPITGLDGSLTIENGLITAAVNPT